MFAARASEIAMDIYVINLATRQDRLREISAELAGLGLKFTRISAIDGSKLQQDEYSLVDPPTDACWKSHQLAYKKIVTAAASNALILEDDAVLDESVDWQKLLREIDLYSQRFGIDLIQLGFLESPDYQTGIERNLVRFYLFIKRILKFAHAHAFSRVVSASADNRWDCLNSAPDAMELVPNEFIGGSHCYMISRRAADICLRLNRPTFLAADDLLWAIAGGSSHYRRIKAARAKRSLASQRSRPKGVLIDSDIEAVANPFERQA